MCLLGTADESQPNATTAGPGTCQLLWWEGQSREVQLGPLGKPLYKERPVPTRVPGDRQARAQRQSSVARCTLTTILQAHFTDGNTELRRREGTLPRSHRAPKADTGQSSDSLVLHPLIFLEYPPTCSQVGHPGPFCSSYKVSAVAFGVLFSEWLFLSLQSF